jgi:flavin-dependent dehydrogenase
VLDRAAFDRYLARLAREAGADYHYATTVTGLETSPDSVELRVKHRSKDYQHQARAVTLASGFNSPLVAQAGLARGLPFVVGAQTEVEAPVIEVMEIYFGREIAPGFFAWLVPTTAGRARVGLLAQHHPGDYLKKLLTTLREQGKVAEAAGEICYQGILIKPLPRTSNDRLIVVGTAAGQVKPTTGGGIYYGLIAADIAAATLHPALQDNNLTARNLTQYDREWRRRLESEIRQGYQVRQIYNHLSDGQVDRLFARLAGNDQLVSFLNDRTVAFDWHSGGLLRLLGQLAALRLKDFVKRPSQPS